MQSVTLKGILEINSRRLPSRNTGDPVSWLLLVDNNFKMHIAPNSLTFERVNHCTQTELLLSLLKHCQVQNIAFLSWLRVWSQKVFIAQPSHSSSHRGILNQLTPSNLQERQKQIPNNKNSMFYIKNPKTTFVPLAIFQSE